LINRLYLFGLFILIITTGCTPGVTQLLGRRPAATEAALPAATTETRLPIAPPTLESRLDQLNSYRTQLILDFEGTRIGQPASGHIEALTEVNRKAAARHHLLTIAGPIPNVPTGRFEFFQFDRQLHLFKPDETVQFEIAPNQQLSPGELGFLEPDKWAVLPLTTTHPPQPSTLNGHDVQRYTFTEADLKDPHLSFSQAQGELWLATPENYIVQYVISATVKTVTPLPGAHFLDEGHLNLRYSLIDVNADITIEPPAVLTDTNSANLASIPRLPDAQIVSFFPALIEYTSAISSISATLFYRDELSALDWAESSSTIFNEKSNLVFDKEGQTLTIIIVPAGQPDKIKVLLDLKPSP
jgi:hypothetical protein